MGRIELDKQKYLTMTTYAAMKVSDKYKNFFFINFFKS